VEMFVHNHLMAGPSTSHALPMVLSRILLLHDFRYALPL
jgi:hypothetical protein